MTEVTLRFDFANEDKSTLDRVTMQVFKQVKGLGLVTVHRAGEQPPPGAKSAIGSSIGELVITGLLSASTVAAVTKVITASLRRNNGRTVTWKKGDQEITLTGQSQDDQLALLKELVAGADDDEPGAR